MHEFDEQSVMNHGAAEANRYRFAARLNSFRDERSPSVPDAIRRMAEVPDLDAVELNYPQHFHELSAQEIAGVAAESGLKITALNMRYDGPEFGRGAFTNPDERTRRRAVDLTIEAGTVATSLGAEHLILWMGPDGFDYPFQVDYHLLWQLEVAGIRAVAKAHPSLRVSIEYKPSEPRRHSLIRSMGDALLAARDTGLPNVGVALDICHALMAGEHPPAAAAMALGEQRLFGLHLNDGYGRQDDGLTTGSVNPWMFLELFALLGRHFDGGVIYFDTFPDPADAVREAAANISFVRSTLELLDESLLAEIEQARGDQDPLTFSRVIERVIGGRSA